MRYQSYAIRMDCDVELMKRGYQIVGARSASGIVIPVYSQNIYRVSIGAGENEDWDTWIVKKTPIQEKSGIAQNEIRIYKALSKAGLATRGTSEQIVPELREHWKCTSAIDLRPYMYMVLEHWNPMTLSQWTFQDVENLFTIIQTLHHNGFVHGDLHLENIVYKGQKNNKRLALIDWEYADQLTRRRNTNDDVYLQIGDYTTLQQNLLSSFYHKGIKDMILNAIKNIPNIEKYYQIEGTILKARTFKQERGQRYGVHTFYT